MVPAGASSLRGGEWSTLHRSPHHPALVRVDLPIAPPCALHSPFQDVASA